jgi:NADH-quinone oxidoreductase subunit N
MANITAMAVPVTVVALLMLLVATSIVYELKKYRPLQFLVSTALLSEIAVLAYLMLGAGTSIVVFNAFDFYPFSLFFILLASLGFVLINTLAYRYSDDYNDFSLLLAFAFMGAVLVVAAVSLLSIFIGLELMSVLATFMIMLEGRRNAEATMKFFLLSAMSIAVFSFALALISPYDLNLSLSALVQNPGIGGYPVTLALVLFAAALAVEAALFPFGLWVPDVYQGSPGTVTAMLAGINKKVAFAAMMLIFFVAFAAYRSVFSIIFIALSIGTMLFGNILALAQSDVKRMLAYSSISQAGYIMIGLAAATQLGVEASLVQIFAHSFMIIGAFAIVMWLESLNIKSVGDYTGLSGRNSVAALALTLLMLSMAGVPPLLGFVGKFMLFTSAASANLVLLAVLGALNSVISIYYYARVMSAMYLPRQHGHMKMDRFVLAVAAAALIVVVLLGVYPQPLISIASAAARSITSI